MTHQAMEIEELSKFTNKSTLRIQRINSQMVLKRKELIKKYEDCIQKLNMTMKEIELLQGIRKI